MVGLTRPLAAVLATAKEREREKFSPHPLLKRKGKKDNNHNNNACAREA
jgi:hypothetical protein